MQKRGLMFAFTSIFLVAMINFVSAQFYGRFSISDILSSIDSSTVLLGVVFIVAFAFINQALIRTVFRDNAAIAGVIAFAVSFGIVWAVNRTGLDFEGFFYTLGFSEGFLATIVLLALIGGGIYLGFKYGLGIMLTIVGGFFMILSFTDFIYETGTTFVIGLIFGGIGIWLLSKKKDPLGSYGSRFSKRPRDYSSDPSSGQQQIQQQVRVQKQQVQQRQRTQRELQGKYDQYRYAAEAIVKEVGHIPAKGTSEYKQWKNYINAVKTIAKMAAKQSFRLR